MVTVLIVDDNREKSGRVRKVVEDALVCGGGRVLEAGTLFDAGGVLSSTHVDLVILDLKVPYRKGEAARAEAGYDFVQQIRDGRIPTPPSHIIGLTEYGELRRRFEKRFRDEMLFVIEYDRSSEQWATLLTTKLAQIVVSCSAQRGGYQYDLAIVTALRAVELEAVLDTPGGWSELSIKGDDGIYYRGHLAANPSDVVTIACAAPQMGMSYATALTMKVIEMFRPRYVAMAGVAAGVVGGFGDLLIAEQAWDYGSGKTRQRGDGVSEFYPAPDAIQMDEALKAQLKEFALHEDVLRRIRANWKGVDPGTPLKAWLGPVASGAAVLEDPAMIERIRGQHRKVIGVEMETYGVFVAGRVCREPRPKIMSIKSVCDRGTPEKNDDHQRYAAYTSASFITEFARSRLAAHRKSSAARSP